MREYLLAAGVIAGLLGFSHWQAYQAGAASERAATLTRSIDLIRERSKTNAEINRLDAAGLCRELGGRWVQPDTCE
ncbi:hypothetical protein [Pseudaminobacter soli (ex Li et al. 2025)]|uniref:Uncharacterized protein n=1 Tax=Pseudaminobacter soli (ex Li et al. 2025) TaxID=1295366 RepID=A0A2P7RKL8_9HYPH|nr:hypothetical protein [Mesorhizobium soli]PSJ50760.1 hypothetical protein C7I85_29925 [Mesorhizobium soli]